MIRQLLQIEKKYDLYTDTIENENYWEYSRFEILHKYVLGEYYALEEAHPQVKKKNIEKIMQIFQYIQASWSTKKNLKKSDVLFFAHGRRVKNGDNYECVYTDDLAKLFPNSVSIEKPFQKKHYDAIATEKIYYMDTCLLYSDINYLYVKLFKKKKYDKLLSEIALKMEKPLEEIGCLYNVNLNYKKIYSDIAKNIIIAPVCKKYFSKILKKVQPKVIVEVNHYSIHRMILTEIARENNIPAIELQHGTMHSEHLAYQYGTDEEIKQLPNYILTFSEYWNHTANMPVNSTRLIATGFPNFEKKVKEYKKAKSIKEKKKIIFVSQGTIGKELSKVAVQLEKKLDKEKYHIIYKLHPSEYPIWKEEYTWLKDSEIEVVDNSVRNIYEYFAEADIQIGVYSTAIYEGLGFDLQTIIYNIGHAGTMSSLVEQGYAVFANNVDDILKELQVEKSVQKGSVFWKENALENQYKEIEKYI